MEQKEKVFQKLGQNQNFEIAQEEYLNNAETKSEAQASVNRPSS